jgi:hypothetical protein
MSGILFFFIFVGCHCYPVFNSAQPTILLRHMQPVWSNMASQAKKTNSQSDKKILPQEDEN